MFGYHYQKLLVILAKVRLIIFGSFCWESSLSKIFDCKEIVRRNLMLMESYTIQFEGYWLNKTAVPSLPGIYCVYTCYDLHPSTVSIQRLIYIGESINVLSRLANHEKQPIWERYLNPGEQLCYSFGGMSFHARTRCEAAMIFQHKPPANTEYVNRFPFDRTRISLSGNTALLDKLFTVS